MTKMKKPVELETLADLYTLTEILGEGGAGRVYGGIDSQGNPIAIKVLTELRRDKRKRFVNESGFLRNRRHPGLVPVIDDGLASTGAITGPFYVMPRFASSLRSVMGSLPVEDILPLFSDILDGVEAAHLWNVVHRDLKPENVLVAESGKPAIADFGIASFTDEHLLTSVNTAPTSRLANFMYAAPEQRAVGGKVGFPADIYALGLMLNELFTGQVPHGTNYRTIASASATHSYLDQIVAKMIAQSPEERHPTILAVKQDIQRYHAEAVSLQKLRQLDKAVVPAGEITDPLAHKPPTIQNATWDSGTLTITLDQPVTEGWIRGLQNMDSYSSLMGLGPGAFHFAGSTVRASVAAESVQHALDHFKNWLPMATRTYHYQAGVELRREEQARLAALQRERAAAEMNLKVNKSLKF